MALCNACRCEHGDEDINDADVPAGRTFDEKIDFGEEGKEGIGMELALEAALGELWATSRVKRNSRRASTNDQGRRRSTSKDPPRNVRSSATIGGTEILNIYSDGEEPRRRASLSQRSFGASDTAELQKKREGGESLLVDAGGSDLSISVELKTKLGLEVTPCEQLALCQEKQTEEQAAKEDQLNSINPILLFGFMKKKVNNFRKSILHVEAPNPVELSRGIHIEAVYDFYTFEERSVRVRNMNAEVFHHRLKEDLPDSPLSGRSASSSSSDRSSILSRDLSGADKDKSVAGNRARMMSGNYELLTMWGVLASKLLHTSVLDFTSIVDKLADHSNKKRYLAKGMKRGNLFSSVRERALVVVSRGFELAAKVAKEPKDRLDCEWNDKDLLVQLFSTEYIDTLALFANTARKILSVQPSLAEISAPCRIFGDIHGQFRDVLLFLRAFGCPDAADAPMFVFNGDFVDRGEHQLEVIGLLFALKILLPERVWLIRGNHEDRGMNKRYGFYDECCKKLGKSNGKLIFNSVHKAFDMLPLACLISEKVLVLHGGIGDGNWQLSDIRKIKRPLKDEQLAEPWIFQLLWSDPIEDDESSLATPTSNLNKRRSQVADVFGVHMSPRGATASRFGWNVTKVFCARNGLSLIVRSHQCKRNSVGFDVMHDNLLMRVFSARDYEGHGNDGAVLLISPIDEDEPDGLLNVRPQVLRSTTKARLEAMARRASDVASSAVDTAQHKTNTIEDSKNNSQAWQLLNSPLVNVRPQQEQDEVPLTPTRGKKPSGPKLKHGDSTDGSKSRPDRPKGGQTRKGSIESAGSLSSGGSFPKGAIAKAGTKAKASPRQVQVAAPKGVPKRKVSLDGLG